MASLQNQKNALFAKGGSGVSRATSGSNASTSTSSSNESKPINSNESKPSSASFAPTMVSAGPSPAMKQKKLAEAQQFILQAKEALKTNVSDWYCV